LLFFNKPKIRLADIIPDGYVDIHSHLLPGIDDGATDPENTILLINKLKSYGFSTFITTPHVISGVWNNTYRNIKEKEAETQKLLRLNNIQNQIKAAAEYMIDEAFFRLLKQEQLLTLKDSYVLIEMSYISPPMQLYDIIFELQLAGYKPILAHPERYNFYHLNFDEYKKLKKAGCLFQLNLLSVTGYYGKPVFEAAKKLLENNMIDFTGSDTHHERHIEAFKSPILLKQPDLLIKALKKNSLFTL